MNCQAGGELTVRTSVPGKFRPIAVLIPLSFAGILLAFSACHTSKPAPIHLWNTVPPSLTIPGTVERLAVLYPHSSDRHILHAYRQLYGAVFQIKEHRPSLKIVERLDLESIMGEQHLQLNGMVSDSTAVRLGRILGADAILLYYIDGPTVREQAVARLEGQAPPFVLTSKIMKVENGEILYLNVVTAPVEKWDTDISFFSIAPHLQQALDRGVGQTVMDLKRAFQ
jgi:hypothetical protein